MSFPEESEQPTGASIITQVTADPVQSFLDPFSQGSLAYSNTLRLDLRGTLIELSRQELSQLPESILLGISNGLWTDPQGNIMVSMGDVEAASVNFSPECLQYTLDVFREAEKELPPPASPGPSDSSTQTSEEGVENVAELLRTKPAIIVLREDLDYYCLPPKKDISVDEMIAIKRECGKRLVERNQIFTGLKRGKNPGAAEQHLIDMLCSSGFSDEESWGFRALEPNKTVVSSLALVRLKPNDDEIISNEGSELEDANNVFLSNLDIPISADSTSETVTSVLPVVPEESSHISGPLPVVSEEDPGDVDTLQNTLRPVAEDSKLPSHADSSSFSSESSGHSELLREEGEYEDSEHGEGEDQFVHHEEGIVGSHKLLLFWRKPARKCWWDSAIIDNVAGVDGPVNVHLRRVWTLELSVVGHESTTV